MRPPFSQSCPLEKFPTQISLSDPFLSVDIKSSGWPIYSRTVRTTHDTSSHRPKNAKQLQEHGKTNP
ncbi:unnamed protein product [Acanthoscelides obtectus]|uniref:Uncharacterized protein n=1 Tax=Acanthoscelides obtectus TaxID=200917 RepID=A0A9P0JTB6_ACAOB|nr:unnamed protein product [Acanthoscelides obtectus]CAK1668972.1 hypothetical protein AOBTE_LOCUS26712 [Acanthoscelides obtectus]